MIIKVIHKQLLQNMEHLNFAEHVLIMCREANIDKLKTLLPALETAIAAEEEALNLPTKLEGTRELITLDEERDKAYRAMQKLIDYKLLDTDKHTADAAQLIRDVLDRYPNLATVNYSKESSMIDNLVTDLKSADLAQAVTLVELTSEIARLELAQRLRHLLPRPLQEGDSQRHVRHQGPPRGRRQGPQRRGSPHGFAR